MAICCIALPILLDCVLFSNYDHLQSHVNHDLGAAINMGALAVSQLLTSAQASGIDLQLETATIENAALLDKIERMSLDAMTGRTPTKPLGKLVCHNLIELSSALFATLLYFYCVYVYVCPYRLP